MATIDLAIKLIAWDEKADGFEGEIVKASSLKADRRLYGGKGMMIVSKIKRELLPAIDVNVVWVDHLFSDFFKGKPSEFKYPWRYN